MSWRKREWSLATKVRYASDDVQLDVLKALGHEACELDRRARLGAGDPDGDRFVGSAPGRRVDCQVVAVGR